VTNPKVLITAGCSFTQVPREWNGITYLNWPVHLQQALNNIDTHFLGLAAGCNDIIANRALHKIHECLTIKNYKPEELLVGIMWSGVNRHTLYLDEIHQEFIGLGKGLYHDSNPTCVADQYKFHLVTLHNTQQFSKDYYKTYHSITGSIINTLKQVLLLQNFLKNKNIPYFFTDYSYEGLVNYKNYVQDTYNNPDINYLDEMVDYDHYLPVLNMEDYNVKTEFKYIEKVDNHPTTEMSKAFAERVIIPHLKSKGYIV
jgi:hypothetical protein